MVARGDLGVELPLHLVPSLQKMMIGRCYPKAKPVITATQMLESMIYHPRPTRAEVSDVANAIYDSTAAVMLSGETAMGLYPIAAVQMMKSIVEEAEKQFPYEEFFIKSSAFPDISFSVAKAAVKIAENLGAKAIFALTSSGFTARVISSFRPKMPIIVLSPSKEVYYQLSLTWGAMAAPPCPVQSVEEAFSYLACFAKEKGIVQAGDTVVLTAGAPFGVKGSTNMLIVEKI
jgi:pyruvate kinase